MFSSLSSLFLLLFSFFFVCFFVPVWLVLFYHFSWVWFVCLFSFFFVCCYHCCCLFLLFVLGFVCFVFFFFFSFFSGCTVWLGSPAKDQAWAARVGVLNPGRWTTREFPSLGNINRHVLSGGIHLDTKTHLHPTACRLQRWTPHTKQPARQEHSPTHQ